MALIVIFLFSLCGLVALFTMKAWEKERSLLWCAEFRRKADTKVLRLERFILENIPLVSKNIFRNVAHHTERHTRSLLLKVTEHLEKRIAKVNNMIRGRGEVKRGGEVSSFLQTVSAHKEGLSNTRKEKIKST